MRHFARSLSVNLKQISVTACLLASVAATFSQVNTTPRPDPADPYHEQTGCDMLNGGLGTIDFDADGIENCVDNCLFDRNKDQKDKDKNGVGDACEWRKRADEEWERIGRLQRTTATEPVD